MIYRVHARANVVPEPVIASFARCESDDAWRELIAWVIENNAHERAWHAWRYELYRRQVAAGQGLWIAGKHGDRIVAYGGLCWNDAVFRFQDVWVHEEYREKGIGTALCSELIAAAHAESESPEIYVYAARGGIAERLYEKFGSRVGYRFGYYRAPVRNAKSTIRRRQ